MGFYLLRNRTILKLIGLLAGLLLLLGSARPAMALGDNIFDELTPKEIREESYFRLVDEQGELITLTGRRLKVGDRYLAADNRLYEVNTVDQYTARARFKEKVKLKTPPESAGQSLPTLSTQFLSSRPTRKIAIYHSHNAECYVPSDGTESVYGHGGIHAVGRAFRDALAAKGIRVLYSDNMHLPHDRGAYRRSRVTASYLLRKRPDAIFDLHRDAAPPETYSLLMDSEWLTKIQIVVGQDNPNTEVNQCFAFDLKGYSDRIYPGLVKGVLITPGDFNQDLSPLSLLLEVGAHTNTKESAENGVVHFSDVVAYYFYGPDYLSGKAPTDKVDRRTPPPALYRDTGGINRALSGTVLGFLIAGLGVALGFFIVNEPQALVKAKNFWRELPERFSRGGRWLRNLPDHIARNLKEYPGNLRGSRQRLPEEGRQLREYIRRRASELSSAYRRWQSRLPDHLKSNWNESREDWHRQWKVARRLYLDLRGRLLPRK